MKIDKLEFPDPIDTDLLNVYKNLKNGTNVAALKKFEKLNWNYSYLCRNNSVLIGVSQKLFSFQTYILELCSNLTGKNMFYVYPNSDLLIPSIFAHMVIENQPKIMKISYSFNNCGNTYYSTGTFTSPNYGTGVNYENDLTCVYKIELMTQTRLQIEFDDFDLEDSPDCLNDYVEILNGESIDLSPSLGKFCGKKTINPIITSQRSAVVIFKTDSAINSKGFQFTVKKYKSNATCGQDYGMINYSSKVFF